jgi:protein-S-isoprenylcysteine O-methyltransferase Ste14
MQARHIIQATLFVAGSAAILYVSRKPLRAPGSHGFYRFFAWEAILALAVLNLPVWFRAPFSPAQLLSWLLLIASALLVIHGARLLQVVGKAGTRTLDAGAADRVAEANYTFENTSKLVRVGAYRFIRHPLYASLLYLAWGVYLKEPASLLALGLAVAASVFLWLTARADEEECKRAFGAEYTEYMRQTRMFIPYVL